MRHDDSKVHTTRASSHSWVRPPSSSISVGGITNGMAGCVMYAWEGKRDKLGEKGMSPPQVSKDKPHRNHLTDKPPRVFSPDQSKRFRGRIASNSPTSITHTQTSPCCVQLSASTRYPLSTPLAFNGKKKDKKRMDRTAMFRFLQC